MALTSPRSRHRRAEPAGVDDSRRRPACRYCARRLPAPFLSFGDLPLANAFTDGRGLPADEPTCPLSVTYCPRCHLVQLTHVVPPEQMFSHYLYVSSTSATFQRHFQAYAHTLCGWFPDGGAGLAVDIGSNDGLLVQALRARGLDAIGVEPATNLSDAANARGVPTINGFFDRPCVESIVRERGQAGIVTANNVFAHVDDAGGLCAQVHALLRDDGLFVIEAPYLVTMCEEMLFDMIYHEHLSYLSVSAIAFVLGLHAFEILDVREVASHGGSLRVTAQKAGGPRRSDGHWRRYLARERDGGYHDAAGYALFADRVRRVRAQLRRFVRTERARGAIVAGYGAPAKGNTLIGWCGWSQADIAYLVDDNPLKQGRYAPGSRIPVVSVDRALAQPPDAFIVFAWNFASEITANMRPRLPAGVRWVVPLPAPREV